MGKVPAAGGGGGPFRFILCFPGVGEWGESQPEPVEWALELGVSGVPVSTVAPVPPPQARAPSCRDKNDVTSSRYRGRERAVIQERKELLEEAWRQEGTTWGSEPEGK